MIFSYSACGFATAWDIVRETASDDWGTVMTNLRLPVGLIVVLGWAGTLCAQQPKPSDIKRGSIAKLDIAGYAITIKSDGKELDLIMAEETQVLNSKGKSLKERLDGFKVGSEINFVAREKDGKLHLSHIRLFDGKGGAPAKVDLAKLVPLDQLGEKEYQGSQGGFYPDGKNDRPKAHEDAGLRLAKQVEPRDDAGKPAKFGRIVLLSVGMSNTSQASQGFQRALSGFEQRNPALTFVNGAQGGMTAARIHNTDTKDGIQYWGTIDQQLKKAGVTREQVQVVWIKQADAGPSSGFPKYAKTLEGELGHIVRILPGRFPNVKLVYLSSRTFGGHATSGLNPEPYAYESAFSVKWLIEKQIKGDVDLAFESDKGTAKAPWLSWGPYLWANPAYKRADGFSYAESDFTPNDGTHLTAAGQDKIGRLMVQFFQNDTTSRTWFLARP
jgi:Cu/Ag efflux protein CusF